MRNRKPEGLRRIRRACWEAEGDEVRKLKERIESEDRRIDRRSLPLCDGNTEDP